MDVSGVYGSSQTLPLSLSVEYQEGLKTASIPVQLSIWPISLELENDEEME